MKIVINACHGGFSLSLKAISLYAEKLGETAYFYKQTKYRHREGEDEYTRVSLDEGSSLFVISTFADHGETVSEYPSLEDNFYHRDIPRDDKNLVSIVETIGDEASGDCARLKVVEIPDGIEYEISDYDGYEHVAEIHRTWS